MAHTTLADFIDYSGQVYDSDQQIRITRNLAVAERMLVRRVGIDFYTADDEVLDPDDRSDASKDWIFATCVITDWLVLYDNPEIRADLTGPYKSERLGDWAFTLRDDMWTPYQDARIRDILSFYGATAPSSAYSPRFFTTAGPAPYRGAETTEG